MELFSGYIRFFCFSVKTRLLGERLGYLRIIGLGGFFVEFCLGELLYIRLVLVDGWMDGWDCDFYYSSGIYIFFGWDWGVYRLDGWVFLIRLPVFRNTEMKENK